MIRYALWGLLGPEAWVGWGVMIAVVALMWRGPRARRIARIAAGFAFLWGLAMYVSPLGFALADALETRFPQPRSVAGARDILVLAGGERLAASERHHRPEYGDTADRMIAGAMLAHSLPAARLWIIGGVDLGPGTSRDVDWTRDAWVRLGVDPRRIVVIGGTADTCENARGVAPRLGPNPRALLVTSGFHMPRSMACFRAAGLAPTAYPVDFMNGVRPDLLNADVDVLRDGLRTDLALHEYAGLLYYRITGRTRELWPGPSTRGA